MSFYSRMYTCLWVLVVSGCGFHPIFGERGEAIIGSEMRNIEISPIADRLGQQLRNHLAQDINPFGKSHNSKFVLTVVLNESKQNLAIKKSEIATRANLTFVATYKITRKSTGAVLTEGSSRMITSYNILTQTFGTLIAEKNARARAVREISSDLTNKIASFFRLYRGVGGQAD
jgi:LPS-assembly lipoprotein